MVQPSCALHLEGLTRHLQLTTHAQLGQTVIEAGLLGLWPLARQALITLQQQRLGFLQSELEGKIRPLRLGLIGTARALERPVAQLQVGVSKTGGRQINLRRTRRAGNALVMQQPNACHIGDGSMRKNQVFGGKVGAHALCDGYARPEKRQLKPELALAGHQLAGDVPPLNGKVGVATQVTRELQSVFGERGWRYHAAAIQGQ